MNSLSHENLVITKQVVREKNIFFYIMECMDCNLFDYIRNLDKLPEDDVRLFMLLYTDHFIL